MDATVTHINEACHLHLFLCLCRTATNLSTYVSDLVWITPCLLHRRIRRLCLSYANYSKRECPWCFPCSISSVNSRAISLPSSRPVSNGGTADPIDEADYLGQSALRLHPFLMLLQRPDAMCVFVCVCRCVWMFDWI